MDEKVAFYREWLPLPKNDFRILAMLADKGGSFKGSLADMCRCLNIGSGQSKTNSRLRASIESLTADGFITHQKQGNTYTLSLVPKETKIEVFRKWVDDVIYVKGFKSESVAWEQVLKMLIVCQIHFRFSIGFQLPDTFHRITFNHIIAFQPVEEYPQIANVVVYGCGADRLAVVPAAFGIVDCFLFFIGVKGVFAPLL